MVFIVHNVNIGMGMKLCHEVLALYVKCSNSVSSAAKHIDTA